MRLFIRFSHSQYLKNPQNRFMDPLERESKLFVTRLVGVHLTRLTENH